MSSQSLPLTQGILGQKFPEIQELFECLSEYCQDQPTYSCGTQPVYTPPYNIMEGPDPQRGRRDGKRCDRSYRTRG